MTEQCQQMLLQWGGSLGDDHDGGEGSCQLPWWPGLSSCCPTQRLPRRPGEEREAHIGRALGSVGPSMLLCSVSEAVCFFLGEPGSPTLRGEAGRLWAVGVGPLPRRHVSRGRGPEPLSRPPGALTPMPAVRVFALTSGVAVILDFLLQMSAFVALVSLDSRRQEVGASSAPPWPRGAASRGREAQSGLVAGTLPWNVWAT